MNNEEYFEKHGKSFPHRDDPIVKPNWFWRHTHDHCEKCYTELKLKKDGYCSWKAICSKCGQGYTFSKGLQY